MTFSIVLHGGLDAIVPIKDAKNLYKYAQGKKEIIIYTKGDHGLEEIPKTLRQEVLRKIVEFFKKTLSS